ncbi:MAG: winged helix-turn-helix domain-containing protein [Roseococcus sp.]|nr:winged helix-turn-helix domain-containing protein [Roseococcus sp.]
MGGVSTWRLIDLCRIARERFGVSYAETGTARLMRSLDLSWQTPRPRHAETDPAAQERFKRGLPGRFCLDRRRAPARRALRGQVPGRGPSRPKGPHGAPLVSTRHAATDGEGPALPLRLHLSRGLSRA